VRRQPQGARRARAPATEGSPPSTSERRRPPQHDNRQFWDRPPERETTVAKVAMWLGCTITFRALVEEAPTRIELVYEALQASA
jgi:hypothetical protein